MTFAVFRVVLYVTVLEVFIVLNNFPDGGVTGIYHFEMPVLQTRCLSPYSGDILSHRDLIGD